MEKNGKRVVGEMSQEEFAQAMATGGQRIGMTNEDAGKYIDSLMSKGGNVDLSPIERGVLERLRRSYNDLLQGNQRLQQMRAETEKLSEKLKNLQGKVSGYVDVLLDAEGQRRSDEVSKKVASLKDKKAQG